MSLATDGVPTDEEATATADRSIAVFFDDVLGVIYEDPDPAGLAFGIFVNLTRHLAEMGWAPDELAREAATHAALQTSEGRA